MRNGYFTAGTEQKRLYIILQPTKSFLLAMCYLLSRAALAIFETNMLSDRYL